MHLMVYRYKALPLLMMKDSIIPIPKEMPYESTTTT
ncbi:hypothetical protein DFQ00_10628 [Paenibacillus barcinonensis]|uniref:Uncharacterized protein n=1 Tax=Paenibacillus barcinonensis TaxID=198119 RepID=A0A2V4VVD6_PAEBA|nr:hypothetical protein DFQ00_10628 [Paenibacillus barcinonensis]